MKCQHPHLVFENGTFFIHCVDCKQNWTAVTAQGGMFDYTLMGSDPLIDTSRHSQFETPRTQPKAKK